MVKLVWTTCARKQLKNIKLYYKEMASEKVAMSIILRKASALLLKVTIKLFIGLMEM